MAEVRLRERDQRSLVVSRAQNFLEAEMRAGFASVVVRVNEIDANALEPLESFARTVVGREGRADLCVVEWNATQENSGTVQIKVAARSEERRVGKECR